MAEPYAEAAIEEDPTRLLELTTEITRLLKQKEERLKITLEQSLISSAFNHEFL